MRQSSLRVSATSLSLKDCSLRLRWEPGEGGPGRKFFELTPSGRDHLAASGQRLSVYLRAGIKDRKGRRAVSGGGRSPPYDDGRSGCWRRRISDDPRRLPSPLLVLQRLAEIAATGELWFHAGMTLMRVAIAFVAAMLVGGALGVAAMLLVRILEKRVKGPAGLMSVTGIDILVDGLVLGIAFAAGGKAGILLTVALTIEVLFLGLTVANELGEGGASKWRVVGLTAALVLLLPLGALLGGPVGSLPPVVQGGFLAFGLIALPLGPLGLLFGGIFATVYCFAKSDRVRNISLASLGFALIFYGLNLMTGGLKPLRKMPQVLDMIQQSPSPKPRTRKP